MWLIASTVERKTGTTNGVPFFPGWQGCMPPGVGVAGVLSFGNVVPSSQFNNTSRTYFSCGGISAS